MKRKTTPRAVWQKIREEYQSGDASCRELAEKHHLSPCSVSSRCKREGWRRDAAKFAQKLAVQTDAMVAQKADVLAERAVAFQQRAQEEADRWLSRIEQAFLEEAGYDRIEAIARLLPQWKNAIEQGRKAYALDAEVQPRTLINLEILKTEPILVSGFQEICDHS